MSWKANLKAGGCLGSASSDVNDLITASPLCLSLISILSLSTPPRCVNPSTPAAAFFTIMHMAVAACRPFTSFDLIQPTLQRILLSWPYSKTEERLMTAIIIHSHSSAPSISRRSTNQVSVGWKLSSWMLVKGIPCRKTNSSEAHASGTDHRA